jgi:phosphocarrier protein FPr
VVCSAIEAVDSPDGNLVLLDGGSSVLAAKLAMELLEGSLRARTMISSAPLVEGLMAAVSAAAGGMGAQSAAIEGEAALAAKREQLEPADTTLPAESPTGFSGTANAANAAVFTVTNAHGLHARPSALVVAQVRKWDATVRLRDLTTDSHWVDASSIARLAALGVLPGHQVEIEASGPQAQEAVYALLALAESGFGEKQAADADVVQGALAPVAPGSPVGAAPGTATGPAVHLLRTASAVPLKDPRPLAERQAELDAALAKAKATLEDKKRQAFELAGPEAATIFDAHLLLLQDPATVERARAMIADGAGPAMAWTSAMTRVETLIDRLGDPYQRARAKDVYGIGDMVLRLLLGDKGATVSGPGVLIADDLDPATAADLDDQDVQGIVLAEGNPASHAAILIRARGIPMVTAAGPGVLDVPSGTPVAMDGDTGEVVIRPEPAVLELFAKRACARWAAQADARAAAMGPARMRDDGPGVEVLANIGSVADAVRAAGMGADGSGLVRTEFLFAHQAEPPSREEQEAIYRQIAAAFDGRGDGESDDESGGRTVWFRTLDAGGDKALAFLPKRHERNPSLGLRGLRLSLAHPEVLTDQLWALAAVARDYPIGVTFPMVSTVSELREARVLTARAAFAEGGSFPEKMHLGIMVEVPTTALKAAAFAPLVNYFSIGTNDLTQYALAADRGDPALGDLSDGLDPGVLRMIRAVTRAARGRTRVSVCGELAQDPLAIPVLLGMGVRSLSVSPPAIARVKQTVRSLSRGDCRSLARLALACADAATVRELVANSIPADVLGGAVTNPEVPPPEREPDPHGG